MTPAIAMSSAPSRRHGSRSQRKSRHSRHTAATATKDLGRWKPTDDLALINSVIQTCDLRAVERGVKFSCHFTLSEISQRWQALLYDPVVSRVAVAAMRNLHPDLVASVQSKALYSVAEEELLAKIKPLADPPVQEPFEELLNAHPLVFHHTRTAKGLLAHWTMMKNYQLLKDQPSVPKITMQEVPCSFSDVEESMNDTMLADPRDEVLEQEFLLADRRAKREIRTLEDELSRLQVLVEMVADTSCTGMTMDSQTLSVIRGKTVRYLMRSKEVTIGRSTRTHQVDVDLNKEAHGPALKVSRRQGTIRMRNNGTFFICNEGKRPIFVDGRPVLTGQKHRLDNNSVLEISGYQFVFFINSVLLEFVRQEALKQNVI